MNQHDLLQDPVNYQNFQNWEIQVEDVTRSPIEIRIDGGAGSDRQQKVMKNDSSMFQGYKENDGIKNNLGSLQGLDVNIDPYSNGML